MEHVIDLRTIYIVDGDPALSLSAKYLLEACNAPVEIYADASEFMEKADCRKSDTVLLDLDPNKPPAFRLLNSLIFSAQRPHIIVMTGASSALKPDDIFPGDRIKVLIHPIVPEDLVKAVDFAA